MDVKGQGVFLTGGAEGIGRAITVALLQKGAKVVFCDINEDTGKQTEAELRKQYGADNVTFVQCDVTDAQQLEGTFNEAVTKLGAVEICVNNAGILDERVWEKMIAVNTVCVDHGQMAPIRNSQLALEHMRRDKGGRGGVIINIVSIGERQGSADYGSEVGLCVSGVVRTSMNDIEKGALDRFKDRETSLKLLESKMEPEVVSQAVLQMIEDEGSNGKIMNVSQHGGVYKRRALVEEDGVSNVTLVDLESGQLPTFLDP